MDILEDNNLHNPETINLPHTVVIPISLNQREHLRSKDSDTYNLGKEVLTALETKYHEENSDDDLDDLAIQVNPDTKPGEITGDISKDTLLYVIGAMKNPEGFGFRWFKDNYRGTSRDHSELMDKLNVVGVEEDEKERYDYLSSTDPYFWHVVGWPDQETKSTYLMIFSAKGIRRKVVDEYARDPHYKFDQDTVIESGSPAMNERQKYVVRIDWE